jgi:hypothetical protein
MLEKWVLIEYAVLTSAALVGAIHELPLAEKTARAWPSNSLIRRRKRAGLISPAYSVGIPL